VLKYRSSSRKKPGKPYRLSLPLFVAVHRGHAEIVDFLIARGCDINMKSKVDFYLTEPCYVEQGSTRPQTPAESGRLDVNFRFARPPDRKSYTPLLWAVEREDLEHIKLLLNAGADPNFPSVEQIELEPALVRAVRRKREDMARLLPKTDRARRTLALACSIKWWRTLRSFCAIRGARGVEDGDFVRRVITVTVTIIVI
jgi:ankyrin repeat protein